MLSYIGRRREWWKLLKELDDTVALSDAILGDLFLDNAHLTRHEKLLVLTSTSNSRSFEAVAEALHTQHGRSHLSEDKRRGFKGKDGKGKKHKKPN